MRADQIQARAVAKIVVVALFWAALAVLLAIVLLHTRTLRGRKRPPVPRAAGRSQAMA